MARRENYTDRPAERAIVVGVSLAGSDDILDMDDSLTELKMLAKTAGLVVVGEVTQRLQRPDSRTLIGSGKLEELQMFVDELRADVVIFDEELSPRHNRELEKDLGETVRLLDRTALILDIFAQHAETHEGRLQVELAQYEYRLPRLTRAWTHLARQAGGSGAQSGVGLRGPGETQLEVDRREIGRKITYLKRRLEKVRAHRGRHRQQRQRAAVPTVALVGYTNAGKSTLLNALTDADIYVADQLFATLDPTTRRVTLDDGTLALFTDTVGFIQKLPTTLVAAFRATLEEVTEADLLLHVVDAAHVNYREQHAAVLVTLHALGAGDMPTLTVLNKIDLLDRDQLAETVADFPGAVPISAVNKTGLAKLLQRVRGQIQSLLLPIEVFIPYEDGRVIALFYEQGDVQINEHRDDGVYMVGRVPQQALHHFEPYLTAAEDLDNIDAMLVDALGGDEGPDDYDDWEDAD